MNVYELQNLIVSEITQGNLTEKSEIFTRFYANSEWGTTDIDIKFAKAVNGNLILSDEPIKEEWEWNCMRLQQIHMTVGMERK